MIYLFRKIQLLHFLVAILWREVFINWVPNGSYIFVSFFQNGSPGLVRVWPLKFLESHPIVPMDTLCYLGNLMALNPYNNILFLEKNNWRSLIFILFMEPKPFTALLLALIHSLLLVSDRQYQELLAWLHLFSGSLVRSLRSQPSWQPQKSSKQKFRPGMITRGQIPRSFSSL